MELSIKKSVAVILLAMTLVCIGFAEEEVRPSNDYRINVATNKNVYHHKDVLRLTLKLLNDSPKPTWVVRSNGPVSPEPLDETEGVFEGVLDEENVDVEIRPERNILIGYVKLIPLGPRPEAAEELPPHPAFRLPLFGDAVIAGHSTRIISAANILIAHPPIVEPNEGEPEPAPNSDQPIQHVKAVGRYVALRPGYYLVDCRVNRIAGAEVSNAQKIIQIKPRKIDPRTELLKEDHKTLRRIDERTAKIAEGTRKINENTTLTNRVLHMVVRYILRMKPAPSE